MIRRVSVSALLDWNLCQRRHYLARERRLRPKERPPALGSGSAVHTVITNWLKEHPGEKPGAEYIDVAVPQQLAYEFGHASYERFVRGATNSVSLVPDWVWARSWQVETPLEICSIELGTELGSWVVHGRTDIWGEGEEGIDLIDFKVSEASPLDLMLWSPQIRYYALGLQALHPTRAVWYKYLLIPTQGKRAGDPWVWPLSARAAQITQLEIVELVIAFAKAQHGEARPLFGEGAPRPANNRTACGYCDFKEICMAHITGADSNAVLKENFIEAR